MVDTLGSGAAHLTSMALPRNTKGCPNRKATTPSRRAFYPVGALYRNTRWPDLRSDDAASHRARLGRFGLWRVLSPRPWPDGDQKESPSHKTPEAITSAHSTLASARHLA